MPVNIPNPRKNFNFSIQVPGLNPFLAQQVDIPDFDIDVVEHGDANFLVKTGGMQKYGTCKVSKISTATAPDNWVWDWMFQVQDVFAGGGDLPSNYKRSVVIEQFSNDGVTVINTWVLYGCWPSKINGVNFRRKESDNTMEEIEFCVDQVDHF
jgi:phage tail-like protein